MKKLKKAFTLVEVIVSILIISLVIITGFQLFSMASATKIKLTEQTELEKNIFFFSEKLFSLIKKGGLLDYEEYFNRKVVGTAVTDGHYEENTGFGNFGKGGNPGISGGIFGENFYYCLSGNGDTNKLGTSGCVNEKNVNSLQTGGHININEDYSGKPQRYGQYSYQFIDYNSNFDDDKGDEDGDGKINRDDDDSHIGDGPNVFNSGDDVKELYLISGDKKKRTYFRWKIKQDEFADNVSSFPKCNTDIQYCRGTIEFLELEGKDWGMDHDSNAPDNFQNDGVIDTWLISSNFSGKNNSDTGNSIIAGSGEDTGFWKPLFSDDINISDFKVFAYPNIDSSKAWASAENSYFVSPYVVISVEIKPSWKVKSKIKGNIKPIRFNTTINLTDVFSK